LEGLFKKLQRTLKKHQKSLEKSKRKITDSEGSRPLPTATNGKSKLGRQEETTTSLSTSEWVVKKQKLPPSMLNTLIDFTLYSVPPGSLFPVPKSMVCGLIDIDTTGTTNHRFEHC
jgi:hypothetical protein